MLFGVPKARILRAFRASAWLSRKHCISRKAFFRENLVFYEISTFDTFWGPHFLAFCRTVNKSKQKNTYQDGLQNEADVQQCGTVSRGLAPPAPFCFEVVGSGRGTEKLERPSTKLT